MISLARGVAHAALMIAFAALVSGCGGEYVRADSDGGASFVAVSPKEATDLIRNRSALLIVDVRTGYEFRKGHIPGALHLSYTEILLGSTEGLAPGAPLLLVCASGHRSRWAGGKLLKKGYNEIYDLSDGMAGWREAGYPAVTSD